MARLKLLWVVTPPNIPGIVGFMRIAWHMDVSLSIHWRSQNRKALRRMSPGVAENVFCMSSLSLCAGALPNIPGVVGFVQPRCRMSSQFIAQT
jgi:hypothetical protein